MRSEKIVILVVSVALLLTSQAMAVQPRALVASSSTNQAHPLSTSQHLLCLLGGSLVARDVVITATGSVQDETEEHATRTPN
jgi:hypothetical protein